MYSGSKLTKILQSPTRLPLLHRGNGLGANWCLNNTPRHQGTPKPDLGQEVREDTIFVRNPFLGRSKLSHQVRDGPQKLEITRQVTAVVSTHQVFVFDAEIVLNNIGSGAIPLRYIEAGGVCWEES